MDFVLPTGKIATIQPPVFKTRRGAVAPTDGPVVWTNIDGPCDVATQSDGSVKVTPPDGFDSSNAEGHIGWKADVDLDLGEEETRLIEGVYHYTLAHEEADSAEEQEPTFEDKPVPE